MKTTKPLTVGLILTLLLGAGTVFADDSQFSGLTAEWWQFVGSIPTSVNPGLDQTGVDCMVGQRGPLLFLVGTFSGGPTSRTCSIPEGEWLFFPVLNFVNINFPNCNQGPDNLSVDTLRSQVAPFIDAATNLSVTVDGRAVKNIARVKSAVFAITVPADNIFGPNACGPGVVLPAGSHSPSIDDGFYTLVPPLSVGKHTIHIQGQIPSLGFTVDVTYNLTIVPVLLN